MMQEAAGASPPDKGHSSITSTDVLIIGFGFSAIPLIRELERDGVDYVVVSGGEGSIWDRLERHGRLDFDLVSSMHTSLYSFELVNRDTQDRYLTSKEYAAFIKKYLAQYNSKVVRDWVVSIENYSAHSIVRTQTGKVFRANHLVISTAFKRNMNRVLNEFDYASARGKTVAITAIGDSVNLMISKLIPNKSRIVLVTNGSLFLDKLSFYGGTSYTLDQLEWHNIRHVSGMLYRKTIMVGHEFILLTQKVLKFFSIDIDTLYYKHPLAFRKGLILPLALQYLSPWSYSPLPNGFVVIKYWPIDAYQTLFDNTALKESIRDGYLLNDIAYFLEQGLVELWPKQETIIDREAQTIRWKDQLVKYDYIVDGDYEIPHLPEIMVAGKDSVQRKHEYVYRDNFMGIVPKHLRNVYLIGYTRPTTGGLNNIIEMQCLFTHKMITSPEFNSGIYKDIEDKLRKYNKRYYLCSVNSPTDHLVFYGLYTDDIAQLMGMRPRLADCRSVRDLVIHFIFPNIPFKYRQVGPYKVDGVKDMVQRIYKNHKGFSIIIHYLLAYALLQLTGYAAVITAYYQELLPFPAVTVPLLLVFVWLNPVSSFIAAIGFGTNSYLNWLMLTALSLTAYYKSCLIPIASLLAISTLTYAFRQLGWSRMKFNDLRNKKNAKTREFFKRYCTAFREVFSEMRFANDGQAVLQKGGFARQSTPFDRSRDEP
jgi:hypothetical protein